MRLRSISRASRLALLTISLLFFGGCSDAQPPQESARPKKETTRIERAKSLYPGVGGALDRLDERVAEHEDEVFENAEP